MNGTPSEPSKQVSAKPAAGKETAVARPEASATPKVKAQAARKSTGTSATTKAKPGKTAVKAVSRGASKTPAEAEQGSKPGKVKALATKKPKLVRDSFTFPQADYALIGTMKRRALAAGCEIKKSEVLRAAIAALSELSDDALLKALAKISKLKTGRPAG